ncbi:histidine kinase N-terminal domain-containing protein [Bacillus sp. FJAT-45350]|uniref:histidine kinase N-terminal domain-containing protein n=1 Tax=Bacillus sp. FJAT-45350 TaxID=2011014 RepID=UPI000BB6ED01|nr:histidine kinase N-terminal domain-containing protein [Bacillus sp. FJAT-45350]
MNVIEKAELIEFLEKNELGFVEIWMEKVRINEHDIHKDKVRENGIQMFRLIKSKIIDTDLPEDTVQNLAYKVAKERVEANINIGDFVYNVNAARTILISSTIQSDLSKINLEYIVRIVNEQFDDFSYHAVTRYTELKNKQIEEKNLYINENHKDRLAILGQMSSSFVHEFRNPLTSVIGFIQLLQTEFPKMKYLDIISLELDQLKFRISQFLHTSKLNVVTEGDIDAFSLKELLEDIIEFLYPSIVDNDVQMNLVCVSDINLIGCKDELKQVFLNMLFNAIDALSEKEKPREIGITCIGEKDGVNIIISNNGPQIPNEKMNTIFEPFYTTKELGTGIGLYVCKKIIERHKGILTCESSKSLTTFSIYLPYK